MMSKNPHQAWGRCVLKTEPSVVLPSYYDTVAVEQRLHLETKGHHAQDEGLPC
jgi:hypothetical protein